MLWGLVVFSSPFRWSPEESHGEPGRNTWQCEGIFRDTICIVVTICMWLNWQWPHGLGEGKDNDISLVKRPFLPPPLHVRKSPPWRRGRWCKSTIWSILQFLQFYSFGKIWETLTENVLRWVGWSWPDVLPWSVLAFEAYSPSSRCWWLQSSGIIGQLSHHHQIKKQMIKNFKVCCWWRFSSSSTTGRSAPTLCAAGFAGQTTEQVFYRKIQRKVLFTQYI